MVLLVDPALPTVAQLEEAAESEEGAGLGGMPEGMLGWKIAEFGCSCVLEMDLTGVKVIGGAPTDGIIGVGDVMIVGLLGKLSERKTLGKRTLLSPRSMKPCSAGLVSSRVSRAA